MRPEEYEKMKRIHNTYWWFKGKKEIINHLIKKHNPTTKTLLDIGCGDGYFFDEYEAIGIEPCDIFKKDNVINARLEDIELDKQFDTLICLDVLEHLEDDTIIRKFIDNNLKPGGLAIITVPAHRHLFNHHDVVNQHYRRYDRGDFARLLNKYEPEIHYYNSILYPLEYMVRKVSKGEENLKEMNPIVNSILFNIFRSEKYLIGNFITGMSLIAIIRKQGNKELI